jgi:hypothetical protein
MLYGNFELQKKVILDTIDRRYNTIKIFGNNLKESILKNYILDNFYGIIVMDLMNFKDDIIYLNTPESILKKYPNFITNDKKCMFEYIFSIKTENMHHYIDLKKELLCDRILICGNKEQYNIMFESSESNKYKDISKNKINEYISKCFNNKLLKI